MPSSRVAAMAPTLLLPFMLSAFMAPAHAASPDYPPRKPGLWEMTVSSGAADKGGAMHGMSSQQCIDAASDQAMRDLGGGMSKDACTEQKMSRESGRIVVDSVCKIGTSTAKTHAEMTGDFNSGYRMETRSTYTPPMMGRTEGSAIIEAKWIGPCKPDQKPGDMVMPNGMKMNMLEMMKARK